MQKQESEHIVKYLVVGFLLVAQTAVAGDIFYFKRGVEFDHTSHQSERVGKCFVCHDNVAVDVNNKVTTKAPGKIPGFGREWAHANCKDCHDLFGEGPVTCKDCHKLAK
jgi:hypothetical protein